MMDSVVPKHMLQQVLSGVDPTEIYSPEKVVRFCWEFYLLPGDSFDLLTGWDFDKTLTQKPRNQASHGDTPEIANLLAAMYIFQFCKT